MPDLSAALSILHESLCKEIRVAGLIARNPVAHKWKAPWRALLLRESVAWRLHELLEQSLVLSGRGSLLGARILLRSAFETLSVLVYLNQSMRSVVKGNLDFHLFSEKTSRLLLGSRDGSTNRQQINITTVLEGANKRYPGMTDWYASLCETAHPNFEGMLFAYSTADQENHVTTFHSRWSELHGERHNAAIHACISVFLAEYNEESPAALEALEHWIEQHDKQLESSKPRDG